MNIKTGLEADYMVVKEKNSHDGCSKAVIDFLERWAELMEAQIANGAAIPAIADATSSAADTEGITGFVYGAAVNILANFWVHGEDLRVWHNAQYGVTTEKGTVNPAILTFG